MCVCVSLDEEPVPEDSLRNSVSQAKVCSLPLSSVNEKLGVPIHLSGQLSPVCVFADVLPAHLVSVLVQYGG